GRDSLQEGRGRAYLSACRSVTSVRTNVTWQTRFQVYPDPAPFLSTSFVLVDKSPKLEIERHFTCRGAACCALIFSLGGSTPLFQILGLTLLWFLLKADG